MEAKVPLLAAANGLESAGANQEQQQQQQPQYGTEGRSQMDWKRHHLRSKAANRSRTLLVKVILLAALLVATIFLTRFVFRLLKSQLSTSNGAPPDHVAHLRLVSLFNRHGDRAPSDALPKGDRHRGSEHFFWPNGLHNLTKDGKMRLFRMGAETRRQYQDYLDYDSGSIVAFSSHIYRCRQSMEFFLRGLYDIGATMGKTRRQLADYQSCRALNSSSCSQIRAGSGSAREWAQVKVDLETLRTLSFTRLNNCAYRRQHPSEVDNSWLNSASIKQLDPRGLEMVGQMLADNYELPMGFDGQNIFSTVLAELSLARTLDTLNYTDHFGHWIDREVSRRGNSVITLLDFYEQVLVFAQRDRVSGLSNLIQSGTLITNLIQSQQVALKRRPEFTSNASEIIQRFKDKRLVVYSSHDTIIQLLLFTMGIIKAEGPFEDRFHKWQANQNELGMFRDGFKMSQYGLSVRFELWELESPRVDTKLPIVRVSVYNRADPKHQPIVYEPIDFGSICRQSHQRQYPSASDEDLERDFYLAGQFNFDRRHDCPFELFRNITANVMIGDEQLEQLCDTNGDKQPLLANN